MSPKLIIKIVVIIISLIGSSCATPDVDEGVNKLRPNINTDLNTNTDPNANVGDDNETELNSLINLPFDPEENVYKEADVDEKDKSAGKKLTAVLKFKEDETISLVKQLEANGEPTENKIDPEPWFPAELNAKSEVSGDVSINGKAYSAISFYKEPYKTGTITKINESNYFVLILQTQ